MQKLVIKKPKVFQDKRGIIKVFYSNLFPRGFKIKRFFFVYGNKKYTRGNHAHKICNQVLIIISGKVIVIITNKKKIKKKFFLNNLNNNMLFIPKLHWIEVKFLEKKSVILTICDYKYDKKEYINCIKKFYKF